MRLWLGVDDPPKKVVRNEGGTSEAGRRNSIPPAITIAAMRRLEPLALTVLAFVLAISVCGQLPPSQTLSPEDAKGMNEELDRLNRLLSSANDKCSVEYQIARTYAAGQQYPQAIYWLTKVTDANAGFDASRDPLFAPLHLTKEFQGLLTRMREQNAPVLNSHPFADVPETDLFPENLAYDPVQNAFYLGSTYQDEIVRCARGGCVAFVSPHRDRLGEVLGLKLDASSHTLWSTSNSENGASLRHYELGSGRLIRNYPLSGNHLFNDLAISRRGDVFVTDTKEGSVYELPHGAASLERLASAHQFTAANGIALSPDDRLLYVASFGDGIAAVDVVNGPVQPIAHPADVCLGYIDGLYATKTSLIAIQNGYMLPRVVRFDLSGDGQRITGMKVLERRNPVFEGITTGDLHGNDFYFIANPQMDKVDNGKIKPNEHLDPLQILKIDIESAK